MMKVYRTPLRGDIGCPWPLLLFILTSAVATSSAWTMNSLAWQQPDSPWSRVQVACSGLLSWGFSKANKAWDATGLCLVSTPA